MGFGHAEPRERRGGDRPGRRVLLGPGSGHRGFPLRAPLDGLGFLPVRRVIKNQLRSAVRCSPGSVPAPPLPPRAAQPPGLGGKTGKKPDTGKTVPAGGGAGFCRGGSRLGALVLGRCRAEGTGPCVGFCELSLGPGVAATAVRDDGRVWKK